MLDEAAGTQRILKHLEEAALNAPEQYMWSVPIGVPLSQVSSDSATTEGCIRRSAGACADNSLSRSATAPDMLRSTTGDHWNGNRIGVVPKYTSKRVGLAIAVSGGQMTAGGGSSGAN